MSKVTNTKFVRTFDATDKKELFRRDKPLPVQPRRWVTCKVCGKESYVSTGQIINCKHK